LHTSASLPVPAPKPGTLIDANGFASCAQEVGATVDVLGRQMRIYDCDENSRKLARELLHREFAPPTGPPQVRSFSF